MEITGGDIVKERKCFLMINGRIKVHFETLREEEA
jgi:hypothetical protein